MTIPAKETVAEDDVYEMEDILAYRVVNGVEQWFVKWKGYEDPSDRTWEPKSNFLNPGAALTSKMEQFRKEHLEKKGSGSRKRVATASVKETKAERRKTRKTAEEEPSAPLEESNASPKSKPFAATASKEVEKPLEPRGSVIVSHIGKGAGNSKDFAVTLRWSNGFEQVMSVQEVRSKYSPQLLDYLLSRVRFRDTRYN